MCGSMVDIQPPTAEIRRGKKEPVCFVFYCTENLESTILVWFILYDFSKKTRHTSARKSQNAVGMKLHCTFLDNRIAF